MTGCSFALRNLARWIDDEREGGVKLAVEVR
jgi:hypothetical protein